MESPFRDGKASLSWSISSFEYSYILALFWAFVRLICYNWIYLENFSQWFEYSSIDAKVFGSSSFVRDGIEIRVSCGTSCSVNYLSERISFLLLSDYYFYFLLDLVLCSDFKNGFYIICNRYLLFFKQIASSSGESFLREKKGNML